MMFCGLLKVLGMKRKKRKRRKRRKEEGAEGEDVESRWEYDVLRAAEGSGKERNKKKR
jgi:hypothetical protein